MPYSFSNNTDGVDDVLAADMNAVQDAIVNIGKSVPQMYGTFFEPVPHWVITGTAGMFANTLNGVRTRVPEPFLVTAIKIRCTSIAGGGTVDASIYTESGGTWTEVAGLSAPVTAAVGIMTLTLASAYQMQPGIDYYVMVGPSAAGGTSFARHQTADSTMSGEDNTCIQKVVYPCPASFTTPTAHVNFFWTRLVGS